MRRDAQPVSPAFLNQFASEIAGIARSGDTSRIKKEKMISEAVREAILKLTSETKVPSIMLKNAIELTTAAAAAAPQFADAIAQAAAFAGPISNMDGAKAKLRAAAFGATRNPPSLRYDVAPGTALYEPAGATTGVGGQGPVRITRTRAADPTTDEAASIGSTGSRVALNRNFSISLTGSVSVSHDSNIFLQNENEVSETITSMRPGVEFRFGQRSRASGQIGYQMAFNDYSNNAGANSRLGTGNAEFSYANSRSSFDVGAMYQQVEQGTRDTASVSGNTLLRRTIAGLETRGETALSAKTSVELGVNIDWTKYKREGLVGGNNISVPIKVYVAATPKLSVSTGYSYEKFTPQGEGVGADGGFYNVGLRGNISEKLSANFSVGYRTREFTNNLSEGFWGFDGSFGYQMTSKSSLALALSKNLSSSASGESLKSSNYALSFSTAPSSRWQFTGGVAYRDVDYGPTVFAAIPGTVSPDRSDAYWEFNLNATYVITSWMNTAAAWSQRRNRSNRSDAEFSNNLLSLIVGFRY